MSKGKRIAPQIQRTRSEDLMASVFPQAAACFETIVGDIQIPDHPLVREVMQDVLQEAMDLEGLIEVLRGIASGAIRCLAVDTPVPSQFAHELLNANPYAFLDEAGLEERRAKATSLSRTIPDSILQQSGHLDQHAIDTVRRELWPDLRDEHELHDLLQSLVILPLFAIDTADARHWPTFYEVLTRTGRARTADCTTTPCWVATERLPHAAALYATFNEPDTITQEAALRQCIQGWLQILGPTTAAAFAQRLSLDPAPVYQAFLAMEMQGLLMRGAFEHPATTEVLQIEWCERRILQRIHRLTLGTRRKQIEAVTPAVYMRWLLGWQHLAPQTQLTGEDGLLEALSQLEGFEAPAVEWERTLLPARIANYDPRALDQLCLSGAVGWGRVSPHPAWSTGDGSAPRRVIPTNAAPITFFIRDTADWLPHALAQQCVEEAKLQQALSPEALQVRALLQQRGACFSNDLQRMLNFTRAQTNHALWELATAGLASADGFDQLRCMMDPRRKTIAATPEKKTRSTAGRWSLFSEQAHTAPSPIEQARRTDAALESAARMLLTRYGVLFRDLLVRESNAPKWRDLLGMVRRLEARGEVRGGRFVSGFGGEQFALPQAVESLRAARNCTSDQIIIVAGADPINLAGIVVPGERIAAVPGKCVRFCNGAVVAHDSTATPAVSDEQQSRIDPFAARVPPTAEPSALRLF
jgi:ATP-dependent Lhr-like helicase